VNFSLHQRVHTGSGAHSASYPASIPGPVSPGVKRKGREAKHSPPSSTEFMNEWSYTSTHPIRLHGVITWLSTRTTLPLPLPLLAVSVDVMIIGC